MRRRCGASWSGCSSIPPSSIASSPRSSGWSRAGCWPTQTGLNRLEQDVLERLKAFEFALRRRLEGDATKPLAGAQDQVPPRFRELVEEYYRSLARTGKK